ncbi:MAG: hypothetical protein A6F72_04990 [Cycloclasticus sp. symbiont of Poecilosclerida sp. N]|nr:MAG: hypothetical protein A6F72_04990 [Cycloclasticus sp. symbiont of Poecilosclerida sp. N]
MNNPTKAFALFCFLHSASIHALEIGGIETYSLLNEALKAKISLISSKNEDPNNLIIHVAASRDSLKKAGVDRAPYLTQLKFTPTVEKNGEIAIDVSSSASIKEPLINFVLEVEWPQGRTLKEFTIILDPLVTTPNIRTTPTVVSSIKSSQTTPRTGPAIQNAPPKKYGPTKNNDTVWSIAKKLIGKNQFITHQQMALALYDNNPNAFYKKNVNALKKDVILQAPNDDQIASRTIAQAHTEFSRQISLWLTSSKIIEAKNLGQQTATNNAVKNPGNSLKKAKPVLLTARKQTQANVPVKSSSPKTPIGSTNPNGQANSTAIEIATALGEENKEIKSRLNNLEFQLNKLQRLLALTDEQLAPLQTPKLTPPQALEKPIPKATPIIDYKGSNFPLYGSIIILALLGLFLARRRKRKPPADTEETVSSDTSHNKSDNYTKNQETDPLIKSSVHIDCGRYQQAEDVIQTALEIDPDNLEYKLKLLDIHFASNNAGAFEQIATTLVSLKVSDSETWEYIAEMGEEVCPASLLFNDDSKLKNKSTEEIETPPPVQTKSPESGTHNSKMDSGDDFVFDFKLIKDKSLDRTSGVNPDKVKK